MCCNVARTAPTARIAASHKLRAGEVVVVERRIITRNKNEANCAAWAHERTSAYAAINIPSLAKRNTVRKRSDAIMLKIPTVDNVATVHKCDTVINVVDTTLQ